ncbi:MAG: hypothetical protein WCH39_17540 [Schlesneria sp.]
MLGRLVTLIAVVVFTTPVVAGEIYVDSLMGRDAHDGASVESRGTNSGPVATLGRAVQLARFSDVIVLRNTGTPYYGSISLTGERHSGTRYHPFVIEGNGATISGLRAVPPGSWERVSPKLWKLTLTRKGYYRLLRNGRPLPESVPENGLEPLSNLKPGYWVAWRGSLYFRQDGDNPPEDQAFAFAADQTGISLHQVSNVVISNVVLQHFRFDGLHAQGLCDGIILDNVTAIENGRAGVVSSGASRIELFGGKIAANGRHQLLVINHSFAIPNDCDIEEPFTVGK